MKKYRSDRDIDKIASKDKSALKYIIDHQYEENAGKALTLQLYTIYEMNYRLTYLEKFSRRLRNEVESLKNNE